MVPAVLDAAAVRAGGSVAASGCAGGGGGVRHEIMQEPTVGRFIDGFFPWPAGCGVSATGATSAV